MTLTATETVPVFLFGARGMLGGELARLLEAHPVLSLRAAVSSDPEGAALPQCPGTTFVGEAEARAELAEVAATGEPACVVLALPHGESGAAWAAIASELGSAARELTVVDLAADFRLRDPELYRATYGREHPAPEWLGEFAYGLPELSPGELAGARRAAAPGCFATALQLATVPAARAGLLDPSRPWILNGITGSSGSGAVPKPGTHHPHRHGNLWVYAASGHRHEAELLQTLQADGMAPPIHFVAHSGPFARGIHLTASLPLAGAIDSAAATQAFAAAFAGQPFVELLPAGVPDLRSVVGSNRASIGVSVRGEVLTVMVTLDNMIKGGAGQALQCLNLMLGLSETSGLPRYGMGVC